MLGSNHETLSLDNSELIGSADKLRSVFQNLVDLFAVSLPNGRVEINYLFQDLYHHTSKLIKILAPENEKMNSLQSMWPIADQWENEIFDLFGIVFDKKENQRIFTNNYINGHLFRAHPMISRSTEGHRAQKAFTAETIDHVMQIAPRYPKVQDAFKIKVRADGEIVIDAQAEIGKNHWGFEKYCQSIPLESVNPLIERLDLEHSFSNALLWSMCCEKLLNFEIDKRTKIIRMIFLELGRIYSNIGYLKNIFFEFNYNDLFYQLLKIKKQLRDYYRNINSNEGGMGICQIGKVNINDDLPWAQMLENLLPWLEKQLTRIKQSLNRQNTWCSKMQTCSFDKSDILPWSLSGPIARAVGFNYDLRKIDPFYYYSEINMKIPLGIFGTAYDIYLVRMEELFVSIGIIRQLLDNLPYGRKMFEGSELSLNDFSSVEGENYQRLEEADGQYGLYLKMGKNLTIERLRFAVPSFNAIFAFTNKIISHTMESANPLLSGINISPGELDR